MIGVLIENVLLHLRERQILTAEDAVDPNIREFQKAHSGALLSIASVASSASASRAQELQGSSAVQQRAQR